MGQIMINMYSQTLQDAGQKALVELKVSYSVTLALGPWGKKN